MDLFEKRLDMMGNDLQIGDHVIIAQKEHMYKGIVYSWWSSTRIVIKLSNKHIVQRDFNILKIDIKPG
jgi:hypothetical protein